MNEKRRGKLRTAVSMLERASSIISDVLDEEEEVLDNIPENLQGSERYEKIEDTCVNLYDASEDLDSVIENINNAIL